MKFLKKSIYFHMCILSYMLLSLLLPKSFELYWIGIFFIIALGNLIYYIVNMFKFLFSNKINWKIVIKVIIVLILIASPGNIFMYHGTLYLIFCCISLLLSPIIMYLTNKF